MTGVRTAADNRIVSYDLCINGASTTRHRRFMRKIMVPDVSAAEVSAGSNVSDEARESRAGMSAESDVSEKGQESRTGMQLRSSRRSSF